MEQTRKILRSADINSYTIENDSHIEKREELTSSNSERRGTGICEQVRRRACIFVEIFASIFQHIRQAVADFLDWFRFCELVRSTF